MGALASRAELAKTVSIGLGAATSAAHEWLTRDDVERAYGLYLMEPEELQDAAEGAAGLLSRRVPAGVGSPDTADLVRLGLALASYIGRQFSLRRQLKVMRGAGAVDVDHAAEAQS